MATPVQYIPQPIFSNVGILQQQLAQDQARHDLAMQQQVAMEDMFAEIPTHPTDIPIKNKILGDFQSKVEEIVDRYGGDYGAAAKDITRLIRKTRQNPFFQLAPERRRLAEEERKARLQLGPDYIPIESVIDKPLQDPTTGEWISGDELTYDYLDRNRVVKDWQESFGDIAKQQREEKIPGRFPGYYRVRTYLGSKESELPQLIQDSYNYLKERFPNLPDSEAMAIAENQARQTSLGFKDKDIRDLDYISKKDSETDSPYLNVIGLGSHPISKDDLTDRAKEYARMTGGDKSVFDASPNAMLGTSKFGKQTGNPVIDLIAEKIYEKNPDIKDYSKNILGKDERVFVPGQGTVDAKKKWGIGNEEFKNIISRAEKRYKQQSDMWESYRKEGLGKWWIARPVTEVVGRVGEILTNSFLNNVRKVTEETIAKNNPDMNPVQVEREAIAITRQYAKRSAEANAKIKEAWEKEVNVDELEDLLNFTTLDATKKGVDTQLKRIANISNTYLTAENFEFLTGDYAGEPPEEILDIYGDDVPEIVGVGGDTENGPIFVVRDKSGKKALAKLNTNYGTVISLTKAFGRPDLTQAAIEQEYRKALEDGSELPGGGIYRKTPSGKHALQLDEQNVLTNEDVLNIKNNLESNGYKLNIEVPKENLEQPYEFSTISELIEFKQNFLEDGQQIN